MNHSDYPLPTAAWVKRRAATSDVEIIAANIAGHVVSDAEVASIWRSEYNKIDFSIISETSLLALLDEKYFTMKVIFLFERWFTIDSPRRSLEFLVLDASELDAVMGFDGSLPEGVAGISEMPGHSDSEEWDINFRTHQWLADYVEKFKQSALLAQPLV